MNARRYPMGRLYELAGFDTTSGCPIVAGRGKVAISLIVASPVFSLEQLVTPAMQAAWIVPRCVPTSGWQFLPDDGLRAPRTAVSLPQAPRHRGAGTHDSKDLPHRSAVDRDSERRPP